MAGRQEGMMARPLGVAVLREDLSMTHLELKGQQQWETALVLSSGGGTQVPKSLAAAPLLRTWVSRYWST